MIKILIIEDNFEARDNLEEILDLAGYHVVTARNGKEGVVLAKQQVPDLIICDIMMPELDGYGVLHILGRNQKTMHIPFVFLSAKSEKQDFRKGMGLGADDYITKPFDENEILQTIENKLRRFTSFSKSRIENSNRFLEVFDDADELEFNSKHIFYKENHLVKKCFYVKSGHVRVYRINNEGKEYTTKIVSSGEFFGVESILSLLKYKDFAVTLNKVTVKIVNKEDVLEKLYSNSLFLKEILLSFSSDIIFKEQKLIDLAYESVKTRAIKSLLILSEKYQKNEGFVDIFISRSEFASIVGTTSETAIRVLSELKNLGILSMEKTLIKVIDLQSLIRLDKD